jgi:hypothetical protein
MMLIPKSGKPKRNAAHMAKVAQLGCIICGYHPVHVHHVCCGRYSQRRAADTETIPLCREHHDELHAGKASWAARYGEDHTHLPRVAEMLRQIKDLTL